MAPITPSLSQALLEHTLDKIMSHKVLMSHLDDILEHNVQEMLDLCLAVRQLKSEHRITKKHAPTGKAFFFKS